MHILSTLILSALGAVSAVNTQQLPQISEAEAEAIAIDAYIYGYPLVSMEMTRQVMTNTEVPGTDRAPMGQFYNMKQYPNASFHDVTTPNADTLYSSAWLDLSKEPYILHVPDENGRYYLMPMLSGWTDVFADPGKRTTGTKAADFAITGPDWKGAVPAGVKEYKSPTNMVWIIGRTYSTGTPEDYAAVHKIQSEYSLKPLSYFGKSYSPPKGTVDPAVDMKTPVRDQVNRLDVPTFFNKLAQLMKSNPPAKADAPIIAKMAKIGLMPGQPFDVNKLDPKIAAVIERIKKGALEKIIAHEKVAGKNVNGWLMTQDVGTYGTDYLQRAFITLFGLGANLPSDAMYPKTSVDSKGQPLDGAHQYVLHFPKEQIPPVNGFWSLTMYNDQLFFVDNALNRYTLSPRNDLKYNPDGSLELYIQNSTPGKDKETNWLPAPKGKFNLVLRLYWPKETVLNNFWQPPAVQRVN